MIRYVCGDLVGKGGFGTVYKCVDLHNNKIPLVMKVIPKTRPNESNMSTLYKIQREVKTLRKMRECPYVAKYVDYVEEEDYVKVIMEYCSGGDLQKHVENNGPLSEADLALVAFQVLQMLKACHASNIVFADVKPSNFCLQLDSVAMIKAIDFGCSRYEEGHNITGTPAFMSPEVFTRRFSYKADIWSLGIMLYWLYTLNFPYTSSVHTLSIYDLFEQVNSPFSKMEYFAKTISPQAFDFISLCLSKDVQDRPYAHEALEHPWICAFGVQKYESKLIK